MGHQGQHGKASGRACDGRTMRFAVAQALCGLRVARLQPGDSPFIFKSAAELRDEAAASLSVWLENECEKSHLLLQQQKASL